MSVTQSAANPSKSTLTHSELSMLLDVVEHTIHCYLNELPLPKVLVQDYPESLALPRGLFCHAHRKQSAARLHWHNSGTDSLSTRSREKSLGSGLPR
ncbi:hypothetical protein AAFX24_08405 [Vibrio mediterranei]|uniref:hypothetical protein n=1 Tax=Vibrio mediterranei TaxID=689 RepID=UPI0038CF19FF